MRKYARRRKGGEQGETRKTGAHQKEGRKKGTKGAVPLRIMKEIHNGKKSARIDVKVASWGRREVR